MVLPKMFTLYPQNTFGGTTYFAVDGTLIGISDISLFSCIMASGFAFLYLFHSIVREKVRRKMCL